MLAQIPLGFEHDSFTISMFDHDLGQTAALTGEPPCWYRRFVTYLALGPRRKILDVWAGEASEGTRRRNLPGNWRRAVRQYHWHERVERYDLALAEAHLADLEQLVKAMRLRDLSQIEEIRDELAKLVASYKDSRPSPSRLLQLIRATNQLHRMTERTLTRLLHFQDVSVKRRTGQASSFNFPACISQPRELRGAATYAPTLGQPQKQDPQV